MPYDLDKGEHSVFSLYYHFIHVVRYRKKVFANDAIMDFLKTKIREIAEKLNVDILEIECDRDHFHMLFKTTSLLNVPQFVNALKNTRGDTAQPS
jgi:putative transposase